MTPIQRAAEAKMIMENDMVKEAFSMLEKMALEKVATCDLADAKKMGAAAAFLQAQRLFKSILSTAIAAGEQVAQQEMDKSMDGPWFERIRRFK